ncbi:MAG: ribosomal protein S18-alanine N-acetyltransferase [Gemmatimonadales bacterium]|nr:MAG: ribosomal protein S18-alanine N-acetyltransferase [Gemmatimonadales bacterium]
MIRRMVEADVQRVAGIEAEAFSSPWHPSTFHRVLEGPGAELWVVDEEPVGVIAYGVLWCVLDQAELANIAVSPSWRGRGLGGQLLDHLLNVARGRGARTVYLEVRESNDVARTLYRTRGFREVGARRDYYDQPREDARIMVLDLT